MIFIINLISKKINDGIRLFVNLNNRKKLKNEDFSLISNDCTGAFILHDLGVRFNSPFVNLWIKPKDYIKLLSCLEDYMDEELYFIEELGIHYPIGVLKDIRIYFQHYTSKEEAKEKWNTRKNRINYDNLFILFNDRNGCDFSDLTSFDNLKYTKKIVFTNKANTGLNSTFYIKGFDEQDNVGQLFEYMPHKAGIKYYDQFDYVNWLNS